MSTTTGAPKAGTATTKAPVATKTAAKAPAKAVQPGVKVQPQKPVAQAPAKQPVQLPPIDPTTVVRLFENIPEYRQYKIMNLEALIQGMVYLATAPVKGIGPGGLPVTSTPYANFLATLLQMAVEKGSKGVACNS